MLKLLKAVAVLTFSLALLPVALAQSQQFDLIIRNGHIIDGTGSPWYSGDIGIRDGHVAAAGLDVLPVEPPVEPIPELLRAYRAREPWLEGRLVITPHAAWFTPESEHDTRVKSAETMRAALLTNRPQNVITPDMF